MDENISLRQWQEQFRAGAFDRSDTSTQCQAGWYDWFCSNTALAGRLKKLAKVVMGITEPFILDNYYIWFKNNCPGSGPLYDDARFDLLTGERDGKYFLVTLDNPHVMEKWALYTERFGFETPEFECKNARGMVKYINSMGRELELDIKPEFIAEKRAVELYSQARGEPEGIYVYREGEHCYNYTSLQDRRKRTVMAVANLKDAPPGFVAGQAESIKGLYVYCPEDAGKSLSAPRKEVGKALKRKEAER